MKTNPAPTNLQREKIHGKDCDMLSNVGIPSAQKDESYCTCVKTPTHSPTETSLQREKKVTLNEKLVATIAYQLEKNDWERNIITTLSVMGGVWDVLRQRKDEVIKELEKNI